MKRKWFAFLLALALFCALGAAPALAASGPTDEILSYEITASVLDDGTVQLQYHIDWKVLRDDIGALEWITVGIPNGEFVDFSADSDTIADIGYSTENGSSLRIDFDRSYRAGETVSFDFTLVQDYMYQMNLFQEGQTSYVFTPGWFDDIAVDRLVIRWDSADVASFSPDCLMKNGYHVWETSLSPGGTFKIQVNYPNDARAFNDSKAIYEPGDRSGGYDDDYYDDYYYEDDDDWTDAVAGIIGLLVFFGIPFLLIRAVAKKYRQSARFGGSTTPKITRTKVVYYPVCQGCGAPRGDGETVCAHCGRSFVKSEEVIKEEDVPEADRDALKYKTKGEYRYSSAPDTYVRVNVIPVPVVRSCVSHSGGSRGGGSRGGGGCAHSSCACACASCACACACACAGGGRAGCTYKDFYRTDLKLRQLELKRRK